MTHAASLGPSHQIASFDPVTSCLCDLRQSLRDYDTDGCLQGAWRYGMSQEVLSRWQIRPELQLNVAVKLGWKTLIQMAILCYNYCINMYTIFINGPSVGHTWFVNVCKLTIVFDETIWDISEQILLNLRRLWFASSSCCSLNFFWHRLISERLADHQVVEENMFAIWLLWLWCFIEHVSTLFPSFRSLAACHHDQLY